MLDPCQSLAGLLLGHLFRPVYAYGAPTLDLEIFKGNAHGIAEILNASRPQQYLHSECQRCGAIRRVEAPAT